MLTKNYSTLTPQEFRLLMYLRRNKGILVPSENAPVLGLENQITMRNYIWRLRKKIGQETIQSAHGGYIYTGE